MSMLIVPLGQDDGDECPSSFSLSLSEDLRRRQSQIQNRNQTTTKVRLLHPA